MDLKVENFRGWCPFRYGVDADGPHVSWTRLGDRRLREPFFNDTLTSLFQMPFNQAFRQRTPLSFLREMYVQAPGVPATGFIFHISRCGSTLVSQMLASLARSIVVSEAPPLDLVLRSPASEPERVEALRWMVNAFAQRRFDEERDFFVKFDSWSILDLPIIKKAFPEVPWIFMYRNPIEVMVSNARMPGAQLIPGAIKSIFPRLSLEETLMMGFEERLARTIAAFCDAALEAKDDPKGLLVNYSELPQAVTGRIARHFQLDFDAEELRALEDASRRDAKEPSLKFSSDSERKRSEASPRLREAAAAFVDAPYARLEALRLSRI